MKNINVMHISFNSAMEFTIHQKMMKAAGYRIIGNVAETIGKINANSKLIVTNPISGKVILYYK
jgi:hypothetical protein